MICLLPKLNGRLAYAKFPPAATYTKNVPPITGPSSAAQELLSLFRNLRPSVDTGKSRQAIIFRLAALFIDWTVEPFGRWLDVRLRPRFGFRL
jgi:hypothetical protein